MKRIRVASLAEQDLDGIWLEVATRSGSIDIANGVIESITATFPLFTTHPEAGTRRDRIAPGVRGFPVGKYIIYYRDAGRHLVIARVIHGSRDQGIAYFATN